MVSYPAFDSLSTEFAILWLRCCKFPISNSSLAPIFQSGGLSSSAQSHGRKTEAYSPTSSTLNILNFKDVRALVLLRTEQWLIYQAIFRRPNPAATDSGVFAVDSFVALCRELIVHPSHGFQIINWESAPNLT